MTHNFVSLFFIILATLSSSVAFACGGLFCDIGPQMVNQAAEKIIFVKHDDGFVTAVVQVQYEGESSEFGWIIPVPGVPEVSVSSNLAFARLQTRTNPSFQMNTTTEGQCRSDNAGRLLGTDDLASSQNNRSRRNDKSVVVAAAGNVGPYDYVVIEIPDPKPDGAKVALEWLDNNNYMAMDGSESLLQSYLDEGMNLLAFRLTKNADAGDIRPIVMKYKTDRPMIPIKLTAVAADDDMGVMVWVLGSERATPVNYKTLEINDTLLNWFTLDNYNDLIIRAANEAGGQGFVTEMVDETKVLENVLFTEFETTEWLRIMSANYDDGSQLLRDIERFLFDLNANCFQDCGIDDIDGVGIALENAFPQETDATREALMECLSCNFALVEDGFNIERVRKAFDDWVAQPIIETQKLIDSQKYFSRFYTTLSASEMTVDPIFDFNPNLKNVTNQLVANRVIECDSSVYFSDAPWRATLPSGLVVRGVGSTWPIQTKDPELSANIIIRQGTKTENKVVRDNIASIRKSLDVRNADVVTPGGCGGCSSTQGNHIPLFTLLLVFVIGTRRKKRD